MTDEPLPERAALPSPAAAPPGRAHIAPAHGGRTDVLPILYLVGFVILAGALAWLWRHPSPREDAAQESKVATLNDQVAANSAATAELGRRLAALEARPVPAAPDLKPLDARVVALENRPVPAAADLKPLQDRIAALENKPAPPPVDLGPLTARVAGVERREEQGVAAASAAGAAAAAALAKLNTDLAALGQKVDAADKRAAASDTRLGGRLDAVEADARKAAAGLAAINDRAQRLGRLQAVAVALAAGQPLGDLPGAPPALARFAHQAPPTESTLRASFDTAAAGTEKASQPVTEGKGFLERSWLRAQQSVTVRQGDQVLVGDPVAGVLAQARQKLDAGDVAGAIHALDPLGGPAKAAMAGWVEQAQSLLDARAAVASMASAQG